MATAHDALPRRGRPALRRRPIRLDAGLGRIEGLIYVVVAALLVVGAGFTLYGTVRDIIGGSKSRPVTDTGVFVMERVLLLFIIAELLYTVRLIDFGGRILVEPFLFIGLIAVVRRILVVTAEVERRDGRGQAVDLLIQLGTLGALALVLAASIYLLRGRS
jgi:uncharacterized membrane protein (DUF373 family)